ncbi:MAG: NAD-dependent deacylase [Bacteroidota bacterium]|nr:NAD-dependent deacylase [Bacteroidota bacterium]
MKNLVVFTGAGISAESGLGTFRDSGGLWENYKIEEVATLEAFVKNPELVLDFYNLRRRQMIKSKPNDAHYSLNLLEKKFNLSIITQNVDDLHERSGSKNVLHLHGQLNQSMSTNDGRVFDIEGSELNIGDCCPLGSQLRPNVVWFGEMVPNIQIATEIVAKADIFIIIGTSLNVYPAASLLNYVSESCRVILIDKDPVMVDGIEILAESATIGVPKIVDKLLEKY